MTISILSLHTYPVKSCAGITHAQISVTPAGLHNDRHWVVVDHAGRFVTQRSQPRMALVQPAFDETALFLDAPEMPTLRISLHRAEAGAPVPVRIWNSDTLGQDEGDTAARWFSDYLGMSCRLYRVHPTARRLASTQRISDWLSRHPQPEGFPEDHAFGFADAFPFLVAGQASLDDLNQRLAARGLPAVSMSRFRPNIVLQGLDPYEEDYIYTLQKGPLTFALVKRCPRCPVPNVDPLTAEVGAEPMRTLSTYRSFDDGVLFGVNAVLAGAEGGAVLNVGDTLEATHDL
jgi:uncharacterized protein YcbX